MRRIELIELYTATIGLASMKAAASPVEEELVEKLDLMFEKIKEYLMNEIIRRATSNPNALSDMLASIIRAASPMRNLIFESIVDKFAPPPAAASLLREQIFIASRRTLNRMRDSIMDTLADATKEGVGIDEAARRLRDKFDNMKKYELTRIARTEINCAQNVVNYQGMQQLRIPYIKWNAAKDDKVRPSHRELHGQIIRFGNRFSNGLKHPGDRSGPIEEWINCRCAVMPYILPQNKIPPFGKDYFYENELREV